MQFLVGFKTVSYQPGFERRYVPGKDFLQLSCQPQLDTGFSKVLAPHHPAMVHTYVAKSNHFLQTEGIKERNFCCVQKCTTIKNHIKFCIRTIFTSYTTEY